MRHSLVDRIKGFTIVELLIVITVIGILAAVSIVAYNGITNSARDASVLSDAESVAGEIVRYSVKHDGVYGEAVEWYSGGSTNVNINFTPSPGNVVDIVANESDYCIRVYNIGSSEHNSLATAATKGSSDDSCETLDPSAAAQVDSPLPEVVVYETSFESGADGWTRSHADTTLTVDSTVVRTGTQSMKMVHTDSWTATEYGGSGDPGDGIRKTVTGLQVGTTYKWSGWVYAATAPLSSNAYWFPVSPYVSYSQGDPIPFDTWVEVTKTFEATSESQYIFLYVDNSNSSAGDGVTRTVYLDDIKVTEQ